MITIIDKIDELEACDANLKHHIDTAQAIIDSNDKLGDKVDSVILSLKEIVAQLARKNDIMKSIG